jgi:biopolymer transport protein ExbD
MRKPSFSRPTDRIPDSALADVAFLLLIFFLATTTIAEEFGLSLILPARGNQPHEVNRQNVLEITTSPDGTVFYVDSEPTSLARIREIVRGRQILNENLVVSVAPSRRAPYRAMVDVLDELKVARARRISLETRR